MALEEKKPDVSRTVKGQYDAWVNLQLASARAGRIVPDRADNNRISLAHFRDFLGESSPVDIIDASKLQGFYLHCLEMNARRKKNVKDGWSVEYAKHIFGTAKQFVRYLWENNVIDLPRNIQSKSFKFKGGAKKVRTWAVEEVRAAIKRAPGQLKLHLLLMVNTGMLQTDISELKQSEVDWTEGRIIRKRSKTEEHEDVPEVNYKLWKETFVLLKQYRSMHPELALTTAKGKAWVRKEITEEGKLVRSDNIASNFAHIKDDLGHKKGLRLFRKTSATLIEAHPLYGRYKSHFLGHSPRTVADKHYAAPSEELFDEIIKWLANQFGFTPGKYGKRKKGS